MQQKVLLVEDNQENLENMEWAAKVEGGDRQLKSVRSLADAWKYLEHNEVDLVVTDLALRTRGLDQDGLDLLRKIRTEYRDKDLPVILVTNYVTPQLSEDAFQLDVFDIVDRANLPANPLKMLRHKIKLALKFSALRP